MSSQFCFLDSGFVMPRVLAHAEDATSVNVKGPIFVFVPSLLFKNRTIVTFRSVTTSFIFPSHSFCIFCLQASRLTLDCRNPTRICSRWVWFWLFFNFKLIQSHQNNFGTRHFWNRTLARHFVLSLRNWFSCFVYTNVFWVSRNHLSRKIARLKFGFWLL